MINSTIKPKEKAIELADKFGISTAVDVVVELSLETTHIAINTGGEVKEPFTRIEYWDKVKLELDQMYH